MALGEEGELVGVGGAAVSITRLVGTDVVIGIVEVSLPMGTEVMRSSRAIRVVVGMDCSAASMNMAASRRLSSLLKVTREFSATQLKFEALKRARIMSEESGMLKFAWAAEISRGMASPRVTFE